MTRRQRSAWSLAVGFARPASPDAFRFRKVARVKPKGVSVLSIAAHLPQTGGRIAGARIAYGAMAPTPIRARAVERALEGRSLDAASIAAGEGRGARRHQPADRCDRHAPGIAAKCCQCTSAGCLPARQR